MKQKQFVKLRHLAKQAGQGMTEYIIIVAVIAIGSIAVYSYFGDTLRNQTAAAASALAGKDGKELSDKAGESADAAKQNTTKNLQDFAEGKK